MTPPRLLLALTLAAFAGPALAAPSDPAVAHEVGLLNEAGKRAVERGDYAAALTAYRTAARRMRGDPAATADRSVALFLAARCLERLGRIEEALTAHREALALGPPGGLAGQLGERIDALEALVAEAEATNTSPADLALARLNAEGKAAVAAGDYEAALRAYRAAATQLDTQPERVAERALTGFLIGRCLEALGRDAEAVERYRAARALEPPAALVTRIDERLGRLDAPKNAPARAQRPTNAAGLPVAAPSPDRRPVAIDCRPMELLVTVPGALTSRPCAEVVALPPGRWRLEGRLDDRAVHRTIDVVDLAEPQRFSLLLPPGLTAQSAPVDHRPAWAWTTAALVGVGAGATLLALEADGELGAPADTLGVAALVAGGLAGAIAIWQWADPPPLDAPSTPSAGVVGFTPY